MTKQPTFVLALFALACAAVAPARAEDLASGWSVESVEPPLGEARSCAATKMTGTDRGIGFTTLSSGMELLTVAVEGWSYPLGQSLSETVKVGNEAPFKLDAFGQNNATLANGKFTTNSALRTATTIEIGIGDKHQTFDIGGLDKAFEALKICMLPKA